MSLPEIPAEAGDIAAIPDGNGWIVGIVDEITEEYRVVRWGDCERTVPYDVSLIVPRDRRPPCAGSLVGKRFASEEAFWREAQRHRLPEFGGSCGATCAHGLPSALAAPTPPAGGNGGRP